MVNMRKTTLLLVLLFATTLANAQPFAVEYTRESGSYTIYYQYADKDNIKDSLEVCAVPQDGFPYTGAIVIPEKAKITDGEEKNWPVVSIAKDAFKDATGLTSISIPVSVKHIGQNAFSGCSNYHVNFSSLAHVLSIDYGNQESNPMFTAGITRIGGESLSEITINTDIKPYAFVKATWLKKVVLGNNVKNISNKAFYLCSNLSSLVIPSVSVIGTNAFEGCTSLKEIDLPSTLTSISKEAFKNCTGLQYIVIPKNVNDIFGSAFSGCKNLVDLIISSRTLTLNIAENAFPSLKHIYSKAQTMPQADINAFGGKTDVQLFYKSGVDYNVDGTPWKDFIQTLIESNTITYILDGTFYKKFEDVEAGTLIDPLGLPNSDREFSGWKNEPRIMPNEDIEVKGSLKYKLTYVAGSTDDQLNKEGIWYFYGDLISDPKELKKEGLSYIKINDPIEMRAKDDTIRVEYSLNQAPNGKTGLKFNNSDQDLINYVSLKEGSGKITYSTDTKTFSDKIKAKDAGDYTIYYKVEGITPNYCTAFSSLEAPVTIAPREITSFNLSQTSYTYDGSAKKPDVIVKYGEITVPSSEYTVSYIDSINAGTATVKITNKDGGNYNVSGSKTFTINKADGSWKQKPAASDNLTYNSTPQKLIKEGTGTSETGTIQYRLSKEEEYQATIPTRTDAGEHTVYYKVIGDANHKDINESSLKVTINEKPIEIPADAIVLGEDFDYSYDGKEKKPTVVSVKYGDLSFTDADYTVSYSNNINVGTEAKVILTDKKGGNYIVSGTKTFTILPERSKLTKLPTAKNNIYNGSDQDLINKDGTAVYGKMQYSLSQDKSSFSETVPKGKNAGSYIVYCKVKGDANHSDSEISSVNVTIAPREITTFALSASSFAYDGTEKKPAVTVTYNNTTVSSSEYTVSYTNNKNAGTATVTLTDKEGGNFKINGSKTFTITKADGSLKQNPSGIANLSYNGKAQNLITAGSSETGTLEYSLDKTNYSTTIPTGTDAKSYTVYYRVKGDANHKDASSGSVNVTIAKAALTISAGYYEIYEGGAIPEFTISYEGFKNNETEAVLTTKPTVSCKATTNSKSGEYAISVSGAKADNYNITHQNGKLVIMAMKFASGGDTSKDEDDAATYQITSTESSGSSTPTVAITDDKEVSGAFAIPETVTYYNKTYTVTEIGESAFENNKNLTEVIIPSSITGIGNNAFKGCVNLQAITVYNPTPINLSSVGTRGEGTRSDGSIFDGVNKALCILYVPDESVELYKKALVWRDFQHIVPLSTNTTGINGITQTEDEPFDIYNLQGQKVKSKATNLNGLPKGIYIINGKKYTVK